MSTLAKFKLGQIVRHRFYAFRGIVFDVDPEFSNTDEWYESIPSKIRPRKDQPFYHLLAQNEKSNYIAYVSEQNLVPDSESGPVDHPATTELFEEKLEGENYTLRFDRIH